MIQEWSQGEFSELHDRLAAAMAWIRSLGVRPVQGRIRDYIRAIKSADAAAARGDPDELRTIFPSVASDLYEANEYATVQAAFGDGLHDAFVRPRVDALASGPRSYVDENASSSGNRPRNLMFELLVGGRLVAGGLTIDSNASADVETTIGSTRVVVECKRPQSERRVERRVKEAREQLLIAAGDDSGRPALGIIALDLTKVANPNFDILVRVPRTEGTELLAQYLADYFRERTGLWGRVATDRVVGLLLRVSVLAHFLGDQSLTYCQQWTLVQLHAPTPSVTTTMRALSGALAAGARKDARL
jgi:hypothetical protein